jgi:hypothetical protein
MGQEISLLAVDSGGNAIRTAIFDELVAHLGKEASDGGFEWTFIGFDPLARFAADAETSNALATAFVQGLEAIIEGVPGRPALGCTHHSSKVSNRSGDVDVRGVTGTRNAFRAELKLLKVTTESGLQGVLLSNSKNNLAPEADDLWLVRCQDEQMDCGGHIPTGGVLVAATPEQADELQAARGARRYATPAERSEAKRTQVSGDFQLQCDELLSILPVAPGNQSIAQIEGALRKKGKALSHHTIRALLAHLAENGRARDLSNGKRSTPRQWAATGESSNG